MSTALASEHRTDQSRLVRLMLAELRDQWSGPVPPSDDVAIALIRDYGRSSAALAAQYYEDERAWARVGGRFTVPLAEPAPPEQITRSLSWATRSLRSETPNLVTAQTLTDGIARRLVAGTGRATVIQAGARDRVDTRWARVASPTACSFCRLMAIRGAVYVSQETALGARRDYHNSCACSAEILFPNQSWQPDAHVRNWEALYADSTGSVSGTEKRREFRRAVEGRPTRRD